MIHALPSGAGRAPRWWVRLAALVGTCAVIVVLAPRPAHAQEAVGSDAMLEGGSESSGVWDEEGRIPADRYALTMPIGFDPAHGEVVEDDVFERVKRIPDTVMYLVAALFHDLGVMITRLGLWLLDLAFSFTVLEAIRNAVAALSRKMQSTFVVGIGLDDFAVFLAVCYCGVQLLRRRTAHSMGELAASMLIAVIGATLVAQPLRTLDTTAMAVRSISVAMMDLASDDPVSYCGPPDNCSTEPNTPPLTEQGYEIPKNMSDRLYQSMIVEPYDIANWGQVLHGSCARTRDEFLRGDIEPVDDEAPEDAAVRVMWERGCREQVIYNTSMSFGRVGVALLTFVVRVVLLGFNVTLSGSVMGGQFMLGNVVTVLPLLVVLGTIPGTGRQILLMGVNATGQASAAVIVAGFVLLVLVMFQTALLGLPGMSLLTRYTMVLVMVITLWRYRGPLRDMVNEILLHFTQRLKTRSPGNLAPNLLADRELWENSVKKRIKERMVDSGYESVVRARRQLRLRRRRDGGNVGGPGAGGPGGAGPPTSGRRRQRQPRDAPRFTDEMMNPVPSRRMNRIVTAAQNTAKVTGKGAVELARRSGRGFRGGLKLSRKALVGAAGLAGGMRNPDFYRETAGDAAGIVATSAVAGVKATGRGGRRTWNTSMRGWRTGKRGVAHGWDASMRTWHSAKRGSVVVTQRLHASAERLGRDMSQSYTYRRNIPQSVIPGAAKRDTQRRASDAQRARKRRDRDIQSGRFLP
jgi:hypothetical protein